jgi:hypothetical protein
MGEMEFPRVRESRGLWVAVHHAASRNGNDHSHIAASMVREDGPRWAGGYRDYPKAQAVWIRRVRGDGMVSNPLTSAQHMQC